jgi:hypothetical protein
MVASLRTHSFNISCKDLSPKLLTISLIYSGSKLSYFFSDLCFLVH